MKKITDEKFDWDIMEDAQSCVNCIYGIRFSDKIDFDRFVICVHGMKGCYDYEGRDEMFLALDKYRDWQFQVGMPKTADAEIEEIAKRFYLCGNASDTYLPVSASIRATCKDGDSEVCPNFVKE